MVVRPVLWFPAMNYPAEAAIPEAKALSIGAVKSMSVEGAVRVVKGCDTSGAHFLH
jgi:hypothetical protein